MTHDSRAPGPFLSEGAANEVSEASAETLPVAPSPAERVPTDRPRQSAVHRSVEKDNASAQLQSPSPRAVLEALSEFTAHIAPDADEAELLGRFIATLHSLFPNRNFLLHVLGPSHYGDQDWSEVRLIYKSRPFLPGRENHLELPANVAPPNLPPMIRTVERFKPFFDTESKGFALPIMDSTVVTGVLALEYPAHAEIPIDDLFSVQQLVHQASAFLHNVRMLQESRYLRDYLETLLDHANAPIVVIGADRHVRVANQAFLGLTDQSREALLGRDFADLIPDEERHRLLPVFFRALRGEENNDIDLRIPKRDGSVVRLILNTASVLAADGHVESVIAIGRDLTKVRELEEQVIQAEKLATLGQLAAGVVHELNNPLTSISVYSDFLLKKAKSREHDPKDVEKLERIVGSAERILRFTRDLVAYSRPNSEKPVSVRMSQALDQSLVFCEHLIQESGARVEKDYSATVPDLFATKSQLHQVFINLITNACHAMPVGAGVLQLSLHQGSDEMVMVRLSDNGCGIPPSQQDHVFEPFFSTKGEGKGTGLGLSIVRNIVQQLGGEIQVESVVGQGTTFLLSFPRSRQAR